MKHVFLFAVAFVFLKGFWVYGQTKISFTGNFDGLHCPLDSITVKNLVTGNEVVKYYPDTILTLTPITGVDYRFHDLSAGFKVYPNYPNPFSGQTKFNVFIDEPDHLFLNVFDISGRNMMQFEGFFGDGQHTFSLNTHRAGFFIVEVKTSSRSQTLSVISKGATELSHSGLQYAGFAPRLKENPLPHISPKEGEAFGYNPGDYLDVVGFITDSAGVVQSRQITIDPYEEQIYFLGFGDKYRIAILMYHELVEGEADDLYERSMEDFENDMMYLIENDFHLLSINDLLLIERGEMVLQSHGAIVTFDDGFASDYHLAFPLLAELDIPATFFIVTEWVGTTGFLTWPEVWLLSQYENQQGRNIFTIGSHTSSHPFLEQSAEYFDNHDDYLAFLNVELGDSKEWIVDVTGQEHIFLALPYGDGAENPHIIETALANGYEGIRTSRWGAVKPFEMDLFILKSIPILSTSAIDGIQYYLNN